MSYFVRLLDVDKYDGDDGRRDDGNDVVDYDDDEDGADHNTTVDDIEAALTDLQVNSYLINVLN